MCDVCKAIPLYFPVLWLWLSGGDRLGKLELRITFDLKNSSLCTSPEQLVSNGDVMVGTKAASHAKWVRAITWIILLKFYWVNESPPFRCPSGIDTHRGCVRASSCILTQCHSSKAISESLKWQLLIHFIQWTQNNASGAWMSLLFLTAATSTCPSSLLISSRW